jgi:2-C-methyl-D-erythritol 4-phosphate cytidylyltransferase
MISVIIPAAGAGTRFGGDIPKQFLKMQNGLTVLEQTVAVFISLEWIHEIVVTVPSAFIKNDYHVTHVIEGGASRSASVYEALQRLSADTEIVLIHDGVRPFVSPALIKKVADAAKLHGAAVPGTPFTDTVKEVDAQNRIITTPVRDRFYQVQTPQGFCYQKLLKAYIDTPNLNDFTDDSAVYMQHGGTVFVVQGERSNIKITTREDLYP